MGMKKKSTGLFGGQHSAPSLIRDDEADIDEFMHIFD